ncbi:MAG: glucose-1-phosphate adenylyltransferase [Firmicutes bacterium]|nr:glucose-1-phosphate adenylyltransferase [Bacillota bacterium]
MMHSECVAMILAGGQGSRLGALTTTVAKPAVPFGGKYRIIDFPLSNCANSSITTVGVLTQYQPLELNTYIGSGQPWDMDRTNGGVFVLPPFVRGNKGEWYKGTANAIYQNTEFIEQFRPEYVLILSGDHIYKMDYRKMLKYHQQRQADATIAVINVPLAEASRYGIMSADDTGRIYDFTEKPKEPKSTLASMGVYIFRWDILKKYLAMDESNVSSSNDFGKDVIPAMLADGCGMYAYAFDGYWKDVGTVRSLWEANMDMLGDNPVFNLRDEAWRIYSRTAGMPPQFISAKSTVTDSCITEGCYVAGEVLHSVIFTGVDIEEDTRIENSIILPYARVRRGAYIKNSVVGEHADIGQDVVIGCEQGNIPRPCSPLCGGGITLVGKGIKVAAGARVQSGVMLDFDVEPSEVGKLQV